jgi:hypothetical protein
MKWNRTKNIFFCIFRTHSYDFITAFVLYAKKINIFYGTAVSLINIKLLHWYFGSQNNINKILIMFVLVIERKQNKSLSPTYFVIIKLMLIKMIVFVETEDSYTHSIISLTIDFHMDFISLFIFFYKRNYKNFPFTECTEWRKIKEDFFCNIITKVLRGDILLPKVYPSLCLYTTPTGNRKFSSGIRTCSPWIGSKFPTHNLKCQNRQEFWTNSWGNRSEFLRRHFDFM